MEHGKVSHDFVTISQWCDKWSQMVTSQTVTVGHMTRVTWGPWESKRIATVVKCISSREMSENSIEFSLSNSEQRDSWLNSGHQTLDADSTPSLPPRSGQDSPASEVQMGKKTPQTTLRQHPRRPRNAYCPAYRDRYHRHQRGAFRQSVRATEGDSRRFLS